MKEKITHWQLVCLLILFVFGSSAIWGGGSTQVGQDSWIALLLAAILSLPVLLMYARLGSLFPEQGFFELLETLFGKVLGKIAVALMSWYALHLCALVLRNFSEFVEMSVMPETPQLPILLIMGVAVVYLVKSGKETMGKWAVVTMPLVPCVVVLTVTLSVNKFEWMRILPIFSHDMGTIAQNAHTYLSFPIFETIVFVCAFQGAVKHKKQAGSYLLGLGISVLLLLIIDFRNTLVLGTPVVDSVYFPSYMAVKVIHVGSLISRIEGSVSMNYLLGGLAKTSICLLAAAQGIGHLFGLREHKFMLMPLCLLGVALASTLYKSTAEMYSFIETYRFYAIPFQLVIPGILWILAEVKARKGETLHG